MDWADILDILGDVTTFEDVTKARGAAKSASASASSARAALAALRVQRARIERAVAAARKTRGSSDDRAALEQRRILLLKLSAAEERLSVAVTTSATATKAAAAAAKEYTADRKPLLDRTISATSSSNAKTKTFLDNIDRLAKMGFGQLAMYLLDQGGAEAEGLAAQAVKSATKARTLQSQLSASVSLADRESALRASLSGSSASADPNALGWYEQVRDLAPTMYAGRVPQVNQFDLRIDGALDPVAVGEQVEKALQQYTAVMGRPVQVTTL